MNLKDAFRFQNKLQALMDESENTLRNEQNIVRVQNTYLRKKVMPEAEDEVTFDTPDTEYADHITEIAAFLLYLIGEREKLSAAIRSAKNALPMDMDSEVSLNGKRQEVARLLGHMCDIRASEQLLSGGGVGYRFNAEGNQVSYLCDVRRVTTINFDRNKIRSYASQMHRKADEISEQLDLCLVNSTVDYMPPFDVNASFADVFESFAGIRRD